MNSESSKLVSADLKSSSDIDYSNSKTALLKGTLVRATTGARSRKELTWLQSGGRRWKTKVCQLVVVLNLNLPVLQTVSSQKFKHLQRNQNG
jgi:hypothetical protein